MYILLPICRIVSEGEKLYTLRIMIKKEFNITATVPYSLILYIMKTYRKKTFN